MKSRPAPASLRTRCAMPRPSGIAALLIAMLILPATGQTTRPSTQPSTIPATDRGLKLTERNRLLAELKDARRAGRPADAAALGERVLVLDRTIFGDVHEEVAAALGMLAQLYAEADDWASAVAHRREQVRVR